MVILTIYPILWVLAIAFSGSQSLAIADLPAHATALDRLRAIIPWPKHVSIENFRSVFADQPFADQVADGLAPRGVALGIVAAVKGLQERTFQ